MKSLALITLTFLLHSHVSLASVDSEAAKAKEDTKQAWSNTKKLVNKKSRAAKDETCHLVNGKTECAAKKVKHKAQNAIDTMKD